MKIKQVEELVGITRKNIRFYEEQGLLQVARADNGYREYHMEDVRRLQQIRLLRKLSIPLEDIRALFAGTLRLDTCLSRQMMQYERQKRDLDQMAKFCEMLMRENTSLQSLDAELCLERMERLEKEGTSFMDGQHDGCKEEAQKRRRARCGIYDLRDARGDGSDSLGKHPRKNAASRIGDWRRDSVRYYCRCAGRSAQQTQGDSRRGRR